MKEMLLSSFLISKKKTILFFLLGRTAEFSLFEDLLELEGWRAAHFESFLEEV